MSIVMPAFNAGPFVARAIRSCRAQTLENWELIVVDDGSTDDTVEQVRSEADERVVVLAGAGGSGPGGARNLALSRARGEFVAPLDADDAFAPGRLELLVARARAHGDDTIVFDRSVRSVEDPFAGGAATSGSPPASAPREREVSAASFVTRSIPCKPLIPHALIRRSGARYPEGVIAAEDYAFVVELLDAGGRLVEVDALTYWHRIRGDSLTYRGADEVHRSQTAVLKQLRTTCARPEIVTALENRQLRVDRLHQISRAVEQLRDRELTGFARQLRADPGLARPIARRLWSIFAYRLHRLLSRWRGSADHTRADRAHTD